MREILLFGKSTTRRFCILLVLALTGFHFGFSQQVIGEFPIHDGGMEAQSAGTIPTAGSSSAGMPSTTWTVSSSSNSAERLMFDDSTLARTGRFFASSALSASATNVRVQSPSTVAPDTLKTNTDYTIQFFYRANTDPGDNLDGGTYLNNTSGGRTTDVTNVNPFTPGAWNKCYATRTSNTTFNASNWAVARVSTGMSGVYLDTIAYDDFVCYEGAFDDMAPDPVTSPNTDGTYSVNGSSAEVSWVAPSTGVDGGGYVVVKYLSMPAADNDPNQNGIYAVGLTVKNGTGSLVGTVAYIGTDTFFTDTYTAGAFYKIYSVDKAFNYSDEITLEEEVMISVDEREAADISIYPNPAHTSFSIISEEADISSVEIYSIDGKKVLEQNTSEHNTVDVSQLQSGAYFLKMESIDQVYTRKIVIK